MSVLRITRNFLFWCAVLCFTSGCETKTSAPDQAAETEKPVEKNQRPVMRALLTTGSVLDLRSVNQQMIIVLFQPECDDCQHEARDISNNLQAFKGYKMFFLSSHPIDVLKKFATDYGLADHPDIMVGQVSVDQVIQNFGQIHAPSIYIYNSHGRVIKWFNGKTDVAKIIASLET